MSLEYVRRCPTCATENAPQIMRCQCGALLAAVDLVKSGISTNLAPAALPEIASTPISLICSFDDCGQSNPPGSVSCLYCNRPLAAPANKAVTDQPRSLLTLPGALRERYRILHPLPTQGAEAELLLVQEYGGGSQLVAKIYRHGIHPRTEVQERIRHIPIAHRVDVREAGIAEGYAFEVMEYCRHGSLRQLLKAGAVNNQVLLDIIRELSAAIAAVHAVSLLHRDLKPENILVRNTAPLDLVLTDFGIASVLDATQRFTGMARTLSYAAPESISGVIDGKADYWALGMIVLESALGKHPFAGLSEAVILHHLTTRGIDLGGISDPNLRKLLRGLLLRDPTSRWNQREITRWLVNDASLIEPVEQSVNAGFATPYHLGEEICRNKEQLAAALAKNWREGMGDMANSQLLAWFRDVQKDQNVVRLLLELRYDKQMPLDLQLLKLILHLAPGTAPVWRGESIELPAILAYANQALKGDEEATHWLNRLYQNQVLENYTKAGNQGAADIVQHWDSGCAQFIEAWTSGVAQLKANTPAARPGDVINYDKLLYSSDALDEAPVHAIHARLLAMSYDTNWTAHCRQRLHAELATLTADCPWLAAMGDPHTAPVAILLALDTLLPDMKKIVQQHISAREQQRSTEQNDCQEMRREMADIMIAVRHAAKGNLMRADAPVELQAELQRYFELLATIKASGRTDTDWQAIVKYATHPEKIANQLLRLVDELIERRVVNAGWLTLPIPGSVAALILIRVFFRAPPIFLASVAGVAALIIAWRLLPAYAMTGKIRELALRFDGARQG